jgi:hypothetical protein
MREVDIKRNGRPRRLIGGGSMLDMVERNERDNDVTRRRSALRLTGYDIPLNLQYPVNIKVL